LVGVVTHFCNSSQSTEMLNKYFKALYFISFFSQFFLLLLEEEAYWF